MFVHAALIYLGLGFTLGAVLLANKGVPFSPAVWGLLPAHIEFLLLGWFLQLAFGVAHWILPRLGRASGRGKENLVWMSFILLNLGIWLVAADSFLQLSWPAALGRLCQVLAAALFIYANWRRVKPFAR
jgi:hypothetical protein